MKRNCMHRKLNIYGVIICVTVCNFITTSDAQCSPTSTGVKRFGTDCEYLCHCMNNEQCDTTTGECTSGCDFEWVGPGCQFKNIAFGEESRLSYNMLPPMYAHLANDRNLSTCSFTGNSDAHRTIAPWWTLWLPYYASFRKLVFVTKRDYLPFFPYFKLTVENVTYSNFQRKVYNSNGVLCYQHDASIPQGTTVHVTCTGVPIGNLIRLQLANTSTQLVICDFRAYEGCGNGYFGPDCSERCSNTCHSSGQFTCDDIDGVCLNGCIAGWTGARCENECEEGKWGNNCTSTCGNCSSATCDNENGECPNGCAEGFKSTKLCNQKCENGTYGKHCAKNCSANCNNMCDKVKGMCSPCKAGWKGADCTTETETETPSLIAVIAGVGAAIIVVIIIGVLAILWYLRRTRNSSNVDKQESREYRGMAMSNIRSEGVKPTDKSSDTYDTLQGGNADEHQYEIPDQKHST